jgi:stage II sporulation protein D
MKEYIVIIIVFAGLLFGVPPAFERISGLNGLIRNETDSAAKTVEFPQTVSLSLTETGEVTELSVEDYLVGCLFAQISINYHEQALKAQAVAAHTYLLRLIFDNSDISDDPEVSQPYFTEEKAKAHYKDEYEKYLDIVREAARYGAKHAIFYDNEPIYAVYHSVSAGVTNTAYSVWGRDFPYLQSVESSWDREHPDYLCVNEMTAESIRLAMFDYNKTASMPIDYSLWFVNPIKNDFGYVISIKAGESLLSGGDMWRIFDLRSTSFDVSFREGGIFVIETRGFGHGTGLSQYGADVLGKRGLSCEEILLHYYTGVEIQTINIGV